MKDRFPIANTLFPLTEHFVSSYENRHNYNTIVDDMRVALGNMCLQMK